MEPTKKTRDAIDKLTPEQLDSEIDLRSKSRFSRSIPYMKERRRSFASEQQTKERRRDTRSKVYLLLAGVFATAIVTKLMGLY